MLQVMRILFLTPGLEAGGAESALLGLIRRLNRGLIEPVVISLKSGGRLRDELRAAQIKVVELGMRSNLDIIRIYWKLRRLREELEPNLIQGWMYHGNIAATLMGGRGDNSIPVIWSIRHSLYDLREFRLNLQLSILLGRMLSARPAAIVYCSRSAQLQHERFGFRPERAMWIPNGCDLGEFYPDKQGCAGLRAELGLSVDTLLVGLVARDHPDKDINNFLAAASHVHADLPEVHFVLAGRGLETKNSRIVSTISRLGLQTCCHLLGERRELRRFLSGLDVLVSSSFTEAFPNVVMQAMACAIPCVVTDVGESSWIVGDTGSVVPRKNARALAQGIVGILEKGSDQRKALGLAAQARIGSEMQMNTMVRQYEELYKQVAT